MTRAEQFVWQTSDANVASVDANGVVTGQGVGQVTITVRDTESGQTAQVGVSVSVASAVVPSRNSISLPANDLVYSRADGRIYASVGANSGGPGVNAVVPIDPQTLALGTPIPVGGEPSQMAISDDGTFLYVALRGTPKIQRISLAAQNVDLEFSVPSDPVLGALYPGVMEVQPGNSHTIAVVVTRPYLVDVSPTARNTFGKGIVVFDDGVPRPLWQDFGSFLYCSIAFGADPTLLYSFNAPGLGGELVRAHLKPDGLEKESGASPSFSDTSYRDILFDGGRLYNSQGAVIDPEVGTVAGNFVLINDPVRHLAPFSLVRPDTRLNRVFFLTQQAIDSSSETYQLRAFDTATYGEVASVNISQVKGKPNSLIRWGDTGLAFHTTGGQVFVIAAAPGL